MNVINMSLYGSLPKYNEGMNNQKKQSTFEKYGLNDKKKIMLSSFAGSALGILGALRLIYKQAKEGNARLIFKNLRYEESDILAIGTGSIVGGIAGGFYIDKNKDNRSAKLREGCMQLFGNLACPLTLLHFGNKLLDDTHFRLPKFKPDTKLKQLANRVLKATPKIVVTVVSLVAGMHIGNKIMNNVNDELFGKKKEREVLNTDYLVHADDACIAASLLLKDNKSITSVMSRALPASFIIAGTKSGIQHS